MISVLLIEFIEVVMGHLLMQCIQLVIITDCVMAKYRFVNRYVFSIVNYFLTNGMSTIA